MSFHEIQFPTALSFGALGGPERRTQVVQLASGFEERSTAWAHARRRFDAGLALQSLDDLAQVIAFFEARHGQLFGFRFKDWSDFKSCAPSQTVASGDQILGVGDGVKTQFQLVKTYISGAHSYLRPITKPVPGSVQVGVGGDAMFQGVFVDITTGLVTFDVAPGEGAQITAGFEFDVPVRFDTEAILVSVSSYQAGHVPDIPVVEIRP